MLEVLRGSNCSLAQLVREQINWVEGGGGLVGQTAHLRQRAKPLIYCTNHKDCVELTPADLL